MADLPYSNKQPLRIGTRGSPLALAQAEELKRRLGEAHPALRKAGAVAISVIKTTGDRVQDRKLMEIGGKGLFTKEIEEALLAGTVDCAIHSAKDMETWLPEGLIIGCILPREDPRDALFAKKAKSIAELLRLARASPGKLTYASAGVGSTFHLCGEMFKDATQTYILHVPYRGGGPAVQDTLAGQVDLSFPALASALPHIKAGTLRALAVTGTARTPLLPEVPTLGEAGLRDFQFTQWQALLAPAGTPPAIVARLNTALRNALNTKELRDKFDAGAFEVFVTTPEEAGRFIAGEVTRFARLIKAQKITAD